MPTALSEICNKERVSYDLKSEQGAVKRTPLYSSTSSSDLTPQRKKEGTDFTATEGTDWEVVRLQRELANLETELSQVSHANRAHPLNASTPVSYTHLDVYKRQVVTLSYIAVTWISRKSP